MDGIEFTLADPDFYVPPERWRSDTVYEPTDPPASWVRQERDVWTQWTPDGRVPTGQGWKVHVSARLDRVQHVLDVVTRVCAEHGVPFKHLRNRECFLWLHHKHGPRHQSGKFCAAYPVDADAAGRLLAALAEALAGERGPYVLTDRRFGSSSVVSYRYGAYAPRYRVRPDGTRIPLLTAPDGTQIPDERLPRFHLPVGVTDPFAPPPEPGDPAIGEEVAGDEPVSFHGYTFTAVFQHSNAGGAYRASAADGREVFVKEARQDNGYEWSGSTAAERLRAEYLTLRVLGVRAPGVAPLPLDHFQRWEHRFLVTELVPGRPLWSWVAEHNPLVRTDRDPAAFTAYYDRCRRVLDALREQIERLHASGYVFVDLNPRNVLVDGDRPRLIDFEEARPIDRPRRPHGAEGYLPPEARSADPDAVTDPRYYDEYALAGAPKPGRPRRRASYHSTSRSCTAAIRS